MARETMTEKIDFLFKLLLIGDSGVGKSCLLLRYCEESFTPSFITTLGIDFRIKTIKLDGKIIKLQIWDTAGQEKFRTITNSFYRGAMGVFLVYDVTSVDTFTAIHKWMNNIVHHAPENVITMLMANKCDIPSRAVQRENGEKVAKEVNVRHFDVSAKTGQNVNEAFHAMAQELLKKMPSGQSNWGHNGVQVDHNNASTKKKKCCNNG